MKSQHLILSLLFVPSLLLAQFRPPGGGGGGGGGSATNAISTVKTNNVNAVTSSTVLEFTNSGNVSFSVTGVGSTAKVSASLVGAVTNNGGFGLVNTNQFITNNNTLSARDGIKLTNVIASGRTVFGSNAAISFNPPIVGIAGSGSTNDLLQGHGDFGLVAPKFTFNSNGFLSIGVEPSTTALDVNGNTRLRSNAVVDVSLSVSTLTTNKIAVVDASGKFANAVGTADGTKFLRDDGTLAVPSGGSGGTNYPPVITITTNIAVGSGVRQSLATLTASNQFFNFQGTPLNGEAVLLAVTNSGATNALMTIKTNGVAAAFYDPAVGSNVTSFTVAAGFKAVASFVWSTNNGYIWTLYGLSTKSFELAAGGVGLVLVTNGGTITVTNTRPVFTNEFSLVLGAGSGSTNYVMSVFTNSRNDFVMGSSNIHIAYISGGVSTMRLPFSILASNLSASVWGLSVSAGTNRWHWYGPNGTNGPGSLPADTRVLISGWITGTNVDAGWSTNSPAL